MTSPLPSAADRRLPIYELESDITARLRTGNRLILQAPTGSGKSTQVPQILLDAGLLDLPDAASGTRVRPGKVVVLQPRRLAARLLAARVARERGDSGPGGEVGYRIRLDNVTSARTRIEFVTEGILLRQMLAEPSLPGIAAILFDEFHERHLYGDITLARALQIQESTRPDLRLVVMSATLETGILQKYLAPGCDTLLSRGRTFPVAIEYLPRPAPFERIPAWELAAEELARLAAAHPEGDALIFMPGSYEISRTLGEIRNHPRLGRDWLALPLHGELPPTEQDAALAHASEDVSEPVKAPDMAAADPPGGGHDAPSPIPGSVDDPYGLPPEPAPGAIPPQPSIEPQHGATGR